jgi:hypothetical protein
MAIRKELSLRLQNSPGAMARVCDALDDERINILALGLDTSGNLRMVVDNHVHGAGVLRDRQYDVEERDVLYTTVPNSPGALYRIVKLLSDAQVNVDYAYGNGVESTDIAAFVIGVADARRASAATGL